VSRTRLSEDPGYELDSDAISCGDLRPPARRCEHELPLFLRHDDRLVPIGTIDKGTAIEVVTGDPYSEVTAHEGTAFELEPGWHWVVANQDLYACRSTAASAPPPPPR
jgi:hypothetical protein